MIFIIKRQSSGNQLPMNLAKAVFQEAVNRGLHIQSYSDTEVLVLEDSMEIKRYVKGTEMGYRVVKNLDEAVPVDPYKLLAISFDDRPKIEKFQREVVEPLAGTARSFFSNDAYLENRTGRDLQRVRREVDVRISGYPDREFRGGGRRGE